MATDSSDQVLHTLWTACMPRQTNIHTVQFSISNSIRLIYLTTHIFFFLIRVLVAKYTMYVFCLFFLLIDWRVL